MINLERNDGISLVVSKRGALIPLLLFIIGAIFFSMGSASPFALWGVILLLLSVMLFFMLGMLYASAKTVEVRIKTLHERSTTVDWEEEDDSTD